MGRRTCEGAGAGEPEDRVAGPKRKHNPSAGTGELAISISPRKGIVVLGETCMSSSDSNSHGRASLATDPPQLWKRGRRWDREELCQAMERTKATRCCDGRDPPAHAKRQERRACRPPWGRSRRADERACAGTRLTGTFAPDNANTQYFLVSVYFLFSF